MNAWSKSISKLTPWASGRSRPKLMVGSANALIVGDIQRKDTEALAGKHQNLADEVEMIHNAGSAFDYRSSGVSYGGGLIESSDEHHWLSVAA
jgi:hypothetical protein